jgi:hypothetical protein
MQAVAAMAFHFVLVTIIYRHLFGYLLREIGLLQDLYLHRTTQTHIYTQTDRNPSMLHVEFRTHYPIVPAVDVRRTLPVPRGIIGNAK